MAAVVSSAQLVRHDNFHWGRALFESFTFLAIEQAYVIHDDYYWLPDYLKDLPGVRIDRKRCAEISKS